MTYHLIIFEVPTPKENIGPIKEKISRAKYERICDLEKLTVDCDKGMFEVLTKRVFSIEIDNAAYIVADCKRIYK